MIYSIYENISAPESHGRRLAGHHIRHGGIGYCGGGGEGFGSAERLPTIIINSVAGARVNEPGFTLEEFTGFFLIHILL